MLPELARRLTGSSDLFAWNGRGATASVNYVCSHDGMTLEDLVSYARKHNEANGEGGRDGPHDDSHNWGVEGASDDRRVLRTRERVKRSLIATLALSQGVPMWLAGDEIGRSQGGNNNAYCHDDETTWLDWRLGPERRALLAFVRRAFAARRDNAVFRRTRHLDGESDGVAVWLRRDGTPMQPDDWHAPDARCVTLWLAASAGDAEDERGDAQESRSALLLLNASASSRDFALPDAGDGACWHAVLDTACDRRPRRRCSARARLAPHALLLLERRVTQ
jgi:glycogen operon protein